METPFSEAYRIKMVEPTHKSACEQYEQWIRQVCYNLFSLKSSQVFIDALTDSSTGAMSDRQWTGIMVGDESYAGTSSFQNLKDAVEKVCTFSPVIPTHQGRVVENVFYLATLREGDIVPGNSHLGTTKEHIEFRKAAAVDCTIDAVSDTGLELPFKGEMDLNKSEDCFKKYPKGQIPMRVLTATNNTAGGQPISMKNVCETSELCHKYGIPLQIDSARLAENVYSIKTREEGYADKPIKEIVREMPSYADTMIMFGKKNAVVNMGGFFAMHDEEFYHKCFMYAVMNEGFLTYGGMNGRDMNALAIGLDENTEFGMFDTRIRRVAYLGSELDEYDVPYQCPVSEHAIFLDAKKILTYVPKEELIARTLGIELYLEAGIRGVEIGSIPVDRDPKAGENRYPKLEPLRLAIPCRTYTNSHMDVITAACKNACDRRESIIRGCVTTRELSVLRHFTVELEPAK